MEGKRHIAVLGSTGSIGRQTLDVVRQHRELFEIDLLTANNSDELLVSQAREFEPNAVVICDEGKYRSVNDALCGTDVKVFAGIDSVCDLVTAEGTDMVVAAMVGFSGLRPTIAALKAGKALALANKETLVAAGGIVMGLAYSNHAPILPIDSEHSAIFQCLLAAGENPIRRIHLTASGGPFRTWDRERIEAATRKEALAHPNWAMGAKITIDSATMMNKGFEVIEAKWLFDVKPADIHVVVHPESIIHSMVEFEDGAVIAQLGNPDMREPIQFALSFPRRLSLNNRKLDFAQLGGLSFFEPDTGKFPCLSLAFEAIGRGGNVPCALNAANEAAVAAFLRDEIGFGDIYRVCAESLDAVHFIPSPSIDEIYSTNEEAYAHACEMIRRLR